MQSRAIKPVPEDKRAFNRYLYEVLEKHYQDIRDIYLGYALLEGVLVGESGVNKGSIVLVGGPDGNTPAYITMSSPDGTAWYLFIQDDGTVKFHNDVPTQNSDGTAVAGSGLIFGEIYTDDNSIATVLASQDTWYDVTIFNANGESNETTPDHTDDSITIDSAGVYFVAISLDIRSAASNNYYFSAFKNKVAGTELHNIEARRTTTVANKPGSVSMSGLANFAVNDTVSIGVQRTNGGGVSKSITIEHANISVMKVESVLGGGVGVGSSALTIEAHTSNDTLTEAESGSIHTNLGSSGIVTLTLPASASEGIHFTFCIQETQQMRVDPGAATIRSGSGQTAGMYKWADAIGESMTLVADSNGDWAPTSIDGIWSEEV